MTKQLLSRSSAHRHPNRLRFYRRSSLIIPIPFFLALLLSSVSQWSTGYAQGTGTCFPSEVWEISTRHLPCGGCCPVLPEFEVFRSEGNCWIPHSLEDAVTSDSQIGPLPLTIVYVHGNWMERNNARERVRIIDRLLSKHACEPYRLIMLSWPSQRDERLIRDVKGNVACSDFQPYYLAYILSKVTQSSNKVSLLGFSLGARSITGALHLDAGGTIPCLPPQIVDDGEAHSASQTYRVCLVAPAVDDDWLEENGRHNLAMDRVELLVNLYNSSDPVLRRYRFIDSLTRPIAAGFAGFEAVANPRATAPLQGSGHMRQYDCRSAIGTTHSELSYYTECPCFQHVIDNLLWKSR